MRTLTTRVVVVLLVFAGAVSAQTPDSSCPIGLFDSGTGGLAVLEQVLKMDLFDNQTRAASKKGDGRPDFQHERFVFLADQANMPYGNYPVVGKEPFLLELIENDARFLLDAKGFATPGKRPVKAIVIACNTATAYGKKAIETLVSKAGLDIEVLGVIDAGAQGAIEGRGPGAAGTIGVLATEGTVASGAYPTAIRDAARRMGLPGDVPVVQHGAYGLAAAIDGVRDFLLRNPPSERTRPDYQGPSLAHALAPIDRRLLPRYAFDFSNRAMLWEGDRESPSSLQINSVENYLAYHLVSLLERIGAAADAKPMTTLVLGCTHFPMVADTIRTQLKRLYDYRENGRYVYRPVLAEEVRLVDPALYVGKELFLRLARKGQLAQAGQRPGGSTRGEFYITVPRRDQPGVQLDAGGGFTYAHKYGRAPGRERSDVLAVPLDGRQLAPDVAERLARQAPETWSLIGDFKTHLANAAGANGLVEARHGMVVSVSPPGSDAGLAVLQQGGNAVDAAVATALAMAVTWPSAGNIGGGGFMMVYPGPGREPMCVEYRETAPAAANATMLADVPGMHGHKVVGVPGTVAGLALAHRRYGKLPWRDLVTPAVRLARDGFPIDTALANSLNGVLRQSPEFAEMQRVFAPPAGRERWQAGDRLVQPELAHTLQRIADAGPDAFYRGPIAEQLVAEMKAGGGLISKQDLAAYKANLRKPIHGTYRGYDVYAPGPPSSGGICLVLMLNILENFELGGQEGDSPIFAARKSGQSPATMHLVIESMRRAYCDRARYLGDADFTPIPARLTSKEYAKQLAGQIDPGKATRSEDLAQDIVLATESDNTTHFSVIDSSGMAVANTYTLENSFGSRVMVRGAGFLLNNEMTDFNRIPGRTDRSGRIGTPPNLIAPGKRMLSSQTPTLVFRDGRLRLVTGSPGGRTIINTVLCTLVSTIDLGMDVRQAVDAPRLHQQWFPDRVSFEGVQEPDYQSQVESLRKMGHALADKASKQGDAHSIAIDPRTGVYQGAADRRIDGKAAGY